MDMTRVDWKAGAYDTARLSNLFTGNDARARIVLAPSVTRSVT
jgi:hypothetical protein